MPVSDETSLPLPAYANDDHLLEALREGDEAAFEMLIHNYSTAMLRLAAIYVNDSRVAEEVVQDTWIGVLRGLKQFEGRSSLKTWIFSILINRAKTLAQRENRYTLLSADEEDDENAEPAISPDRFYPADTSNASEWISIPRRFDEIPEDRLLSQETRAHIDHAISLLPPTQREVITLRDIEQWSSEEVCNVLGITETNQRVLLHRARARVRQALENYLHN